LIIFRLRKNFNGLVIRKICLFILAFFLFFFPKGGFKIGEIPITWGYLLIGFFTIFLAFRNLKIIQKNHLIILAFLVPFQLISLLHLIINGFENLGFAISFLINFIFLPITFFIILSSDIKNMSLNFLLKIIQKGIFFLACYGIFLFFFKIFTGKFFGIPMLTTNFNDSLSMESKNIARGGIFKLVSTYNNGNIYGICMLMILPIYQYIEKRISRKFIIKLALLLTLSRTVWIGLIINELFEILFQTNNRLIKNIKLIGFSMCFTGIIIFIAEKTNLSSSFFLDISLGNRINQFNSLFKSGLFSHKTFRSITEVTYMSILKNFGYLGLFTYLIGMFAPFIIKYKKSINSPFSNIIALGLINYLIISLSDGATLYIPTLALFWFLTALMTINLNDKPLPNSLL
jgi:hypothetical protein